MARPRKVKPEMDDVVEEVTQDMGETDLLAEIQATNDLLRLETLHNIAKEEGNLLALAALETKKTSLLSMGAGADSPNDPYMGAAPAGEKYSATKRKPVMEHDLGKGSRAQQKLTEEQRITMQLSGEDVKKRSNDIFKLSRLLAKNEGNLTYSWGNILHWQKEILTKDGGVAVPYKPSKIFLKVCPNCGKKNQHQDGEFGDCFHCHFSMEEKVREMMAKYPDQFPDVRLAEAG